MKTIAVTAFSLPSEVWVRVAAGLALVAERPQRGGDGLARAAPRPQLGSDTIARAALNTAVTISPDGTFKRSPF